MGDGAPDAGASVAAVGGAGVSVTALVGDGDTVAGGALVGLDVGASVGATVGASVGASVEASVGASLGPGVGTAVGPDVALGMTAAVGRVVGVLALGVGVNCAVEMGGVLPTDWVGEQAAAPVTTRASTMPTSAFLEFLIITVMSKYLLLSRPSPLDMAI